MQGAERTFRTDAAGSNIVGQGYGTGSSSGLLGKKKAQAWSTLNQNFGDLIEQGGGYRNMYSDEGVNKNLLKQASDLAKGSQGFYSGNTDPGIVGGVTDMAGATSDEISKLVGSGTGLGKTATDALMWTNPVTAPLALYGALGSTLGGSKAKAQGAADFAAQQNALANLRANLENKINTSGLKNQLTVNRNEAQDDELFKLLGMLDTTNL